MAELHVKDLTVSYKNRKTTTIALDRFSATFGDGLNVVLGYSGCGKSTLLKAILGLIPYSGEIFYDGEDVSFTDTKNRNFSYVSQEYQLYPMYTVFDNIAFPLKIMGAKKEEIKERVNAIAAVSDLTSCLSRKPRHISGGQQQRVAIARALVKCPRLTLLDEPFSNIDPQIRGSMMRWFKKLLSDFGSQGILVTHNFEEALLLGDRIFIMDKGQLVLSGTPSQVFDSPHPVVRALAEGSGLR